MIERYVHKEPIVLAQRYDGNPRGLMNDEEAGTFWFNLFNSGQAKYDTKTGVLILDVEQGIKATVNVGDYIIYYQGVMPPYGGVSKIIRIDASKDFGELFETQENRNNRLTRTGYSHE